MNLNGLNKFKYKSLNSDIYIWFYSYDSSDKLLNKKRNFPMLLLGILMDILMNFILFKLLV